MVWALAALSDTMTVILIKTRPAISRITSYAGVQSESSVPINPLA